MSILIGIHMATAQRGPSEATTGRRIPPLTSCRTSTFVRRFEGESDAWSRSLAERSEKGPRQNDGYEPRELKDRPDRLPSCKRTVDACEDRLLGYPGAEFEQVRARPGRREHVGQRERCSQIAKRSGSHRCSPVDREGDRERDCEDWCLSQAQDRSRIRCEGPRLDGSPPWR